MSKSKPITPGVAIFCGGLIAGILDAADGVGLLLRCRLQPDPSSEIHGQRLLWSGRFSKGKFLRHAWSPCPFFHRLHGRRYLPGSNRFLPMLSREPVMWGTIYGAAVFIVMNFVVLPHTAVVQSPLFLPLLLNGVLGHAFFVGLPIALAARRITKQSSFSTQAA